MEAVSSKEKDNVKNLTEGNPWKLILFFALPLMLGNVFQQMYTVVDTAVVGKGIGVEALAALGASDWLNWMMLGMLQGFTQGFGILMAQKFGAGEYGRLRQVVANALVLCLILAVLMTACGEGFLEIFLDLLKTPEEIKPVSMSYMRIIFAGLPVVIAYNIAASVLRALGNGKTPLVAMIIASVTNIILDLLFVLVFEWGVEGAAIATVIAQCISAVYCFWHVSRIKILRLCREDWKIERALCGNLMKLGIPMAFQNTIIAVGGMIVQSIVNGFGVAFLAGYTATNKLYGLLEIAATSYGFAMTTYAGQNLGAGKINRISKGMRAGIVLGILTSFVIAGIMILLGKTILSCFITADAGQGMEALRIGYQYLVMMSAGLPMLYILYICRSCVQGLGNTILPMGSGIAEFIMRTASAMFLPAMVGGVGVMYAELLAWLGADLILVPSYFIVMNKIKTERKTIEMKKGESV